MVELLILCSIIIVSRFVYGTIFTFSLFVGISLCVYFISVNVSIVFALITLIIPIILKIKNN